jgi:hypothetical protein
VAEGMASEATRPWGEAMLTIRPQRCGCGHKCHRRCRRGVRGRKPAVFIGTAGGQISSRAPRAEMAFRRYGEPEQRAIIAGEQE